MTFTVLHVCLGNICRSPMAERLLVHRLTQRYTEQGVHDTAELVHSHSVGTGDWHIGEEMDAGSARQLARLGASAAGFRARTLEARHLDESDLILTATTIHAKAAAYLVPEMRDRIFVLRHFGHLAGMVDPADLPAYEPTPEAVAARGESLVAAVQELKREQPARADDDLTDPWHAGEQVFARVADEIDEALAPLVRALAN